jgi:hypothetical protein
MGMGVTKGTWLFLLLGAEMAGKRESGMRQAGLATVNGLVGRM